MKTEYRVIFTATFDTAAEQDKCYNAIKKKIEDLKLAAVYKRADLTKDAYFINEPVSEKVI